MLRVYLRTLGLEVLGFTVFNILHVGGKCKNVCEQSACDGHYMGHMLGQPLLLHIQSS